ncbi:MULTISPECIES: hypothetical protein [Anaeromyxobacter]|uniref:hypothetical protein n=1 Tax=Anaeromyxobacter TaxID=161492 RepID=UPI001F59F9C5|nr:MULTISPECIES: hypothetical protein [unclassified Anaeromyxobacter]
MERPPPQGEDEGFAPDDLELEAGGDAAGSRGLIPEAVKKAILAGVGAVFMTEEGARRLARDWKLPKDVIAFVGNQAHAAKDEILRAVSDEIRGFLQSEALRREFLNALADRTIEVKMEIRVRPDAEGAPRAEVKTAATRGKRARRKAKR